MSVLSTSYKPGQVKKVSLSLDFETVSKGFLEVTIPNDENRTKQSDI